MNRPSKGRIEEIREVAQVCAAIPDDDCANSNALGDCLTEIDALRAEQRRLRKLVRELRNEIRAMKAVAAQERAMPVFDEAEEESK